MESIEINNIRIYARHGVGEQERNVGNTFEVSVRLDCDLSRSMESDSVCDTINYAEVIELVKEEMSHPSQLLEHVAGRLRSSIIERYPTVRGGMIRVAKLVPPVSAQLASVAITTRW